MAKKLSCKQRHRQRRGDRAETGAVALDPEKYLSFEKVMFLLNYARNKAGGGSVRAAVNLMLLESYFYTGLRAIELLGLELRDLPYFHKQSNIVRVSAKFTKRNRPRNIIVSPKIIEKWQVFIERFHKRALTEVRTGDRVRKERALSRPLFVNEAGKPMEYHNMYYRLKTIARNSGIDLRAHMCRHTYGTQLLQKSGDLAFVQDQLGHARVATTKIYAKTIKSFGLQQLGKLDFG